MTPTERIHMEQDARPRRIQWANVLVVLFAVGVLLSCEVQWLRAIDQTVAEQRERW